MGGLVLDVGGSPWAGAHGGGRVGGQLLGVDGDLAGVGGVADEDDDVIHIEGVVEGVKGRVDLEDAAGYVGAEHDLAFVFVNGGDVAGPDLKVMQGCQRLVVAAHWDEL